MSLGITEPSEAESFEGVALPSARPSVAGDTAPSQRTPRDFSKKARREGDVIERADEMTSSHVKQTTGKLGAATSIGQMRRLLARDCADMFARCRRCGAACATRVTSRSVLLSNMARPDARQCR